MMKQQTLPSFVAVGLFGVLCIACKTEGKPGQDPAGDKAGAAVSTMNSQRRATRGRPGQRQVAPRRVAARRVAAGPRRAPGSTAGLLLGPVPKDADLSAEARYLYGRIVCQGRPADGPCKSLAQAITAYRDSYIKPMRPWLAKRRPAKLPPALLYPFSGGDLISALSVYPDQRQFLHFSLEHAGPVTAIRGMSAALEQQARWKLVWMARNLLSAGESFSVDLKKQEQAELPGTLPLLLVALQVHGGTITGLSYVKIKPDGSLVRYSRAELTAASPKAARKAPKWKDPRFSMRFSNVELRFRLKGDTEDRSILHVAANLSNAGLAKRPGIVQLIGRLGPHALMIKAASYLMWDNGFSTIRDTIFARAVWGISDVSAPYPAWLMKHGWRLETYGRFECLKKKRMHQSSIGWRVLFRRPKSRVLPFRYGYVDCKSRWHAVLLYRKSAK